MIDNPYRITVLGIKGGVGKSTISLMIGKELASRGKKVLIVDRDIIGFSSSVFNISSAGLLTKVVSGENNFENCIKKIYINEGLLANLKLFGDGERTYEDLDYIHKHQDLKEKFSSLYKEFISKDEYEYFIIDNPPNILLNSEIAKHEVENFYSIYTNAKSLRMYVSNFSENVINTTVKYMNDVENNSTVPGYPFSFIINMVPSLEDSINKAREKLDKIVKTSLVRFGLIIPLYPSLNTQNYGVTDLPEINEIKNLVELLLQENQQNKKEIISSDPINELAKVVNSNTVILVRGLPSSGKLRFAKNVLEYIQQRNEISVALITTNDKILSEINDKTLPKIKFTNITVLPKYREERFMSKNIADVLKLAKRLSTDILSQLNNDEKIIILYRTNDVTPASNCCDMTSQKYEFWNTLISSLKYKSQASIVLICDDIKDECEEIEPHVNYLVKISEDGLYKIKEII
ncbi:tyrosine-protein kinase family protein [Acidianus manzaensis]|uniref:AAA domain-containing protein n=1 Tax=Acidianus manzaensis TaxID=282676 RepID=A0A1W6JX02_9CREN|nr:ParA family protein [Acidianus manzaensis]ARM74777.1 hypothetical protein B6F84_01215 [Acidianus manzaensis]